jgi:hypothetical protein
MNEFDFLNDSSDFAESVEKFSGSKLKRKIEIIKIYEESKKNKDEKLFEKLVFNSKYVMGLMRALQKSSSLIEKKDLERIKINFSDNLKATITQIKEVLRNCDEESKKHFNETFFVLSGESFLNLTELLSDLEWAKMYLNFKKRQK